MVMVVLCDVRRYVAGHGGSARTLAFNAGIMGLACAGVCCFLTEAQ